jgi:hypothetical protein
MTPRPKKTSIMSDLQQRVQTVLDNAVKSPQGPVGLVFGAIDKNGRVLVNESAGLRSLAHGEKVSSFRFSDGGALLLTP